MEKLFQEFESVTYDQWLEKIEKDLKGKSIDILHSQPESGIDLKAFHHPDEKTYVEISGNLDPEKVDWSVRQEFHSAPSNKEILQALNDGVDHLGLTYETAHEFEKLTTEVQFEYIGTDIRFENLKAAKELQIAQRIHLNFDIVGLNLKSGEWDHSMDDFFEFFNEQKNHRTIWISANDYGAAGASSIQELAFSLAHLNEYIHHLIENEISLAEINDKLTIHISVNNNFFLNIAKLRAIRELVKLVFSAYDSDYSVRPIALFAKTSKRHLCQNDHHNNLLRQTAQCAAAALGGGQIITVDCLPNSGNTRLSKNIQLILKEESFLNKVLDPASGAYAIENLTNQLIEQSWSLFQKIEQDGGLIGWIKEAKLQQLIEGHKKTLIEQMLDGSSTLLGVNKHQNKSETWVENSSQPSNPEPTFPALKDFILEEQYSPKEVVE